MKQPNVQLNTVLDDIKMGKTAHCYLIYGDEEYLVKDALHQIIDLLIPGEERNLNLFWMDGNSTDIDTICESILTPPLIPGKKVVVVNNTTIFYSKASLPDVAKEVIGNIEREPRRAAKAFGLFLQMAGWTLEELQDDGWKKISDDDWRKTVGEETGTTREKWLPKIIEISASLGIQARKGTDHADLLEEILKKGLPPDNCLILTADLVDRRKKIFKIISNAGVLLHFSRIKGEERQKHLLLDAAREILEREGKKLSPGAIAALGRKTGFNLRESMGELEKLVTYAGDRVLINEGDIAAITEKTREDSVFDLTSALVGKNLKKAFSTFRDLLDHGFHHLMILTMIAREIRFLLQGKILLKSGRLPSFHNGMDFNKFQNVVYPEIANLKSKQGKKSRWLMGQHPYVIYNALKNSERFSYDELVGYLEYISNIDVALKTTGKDPKLTLERLLIDICKKTTKG